MSRLMKTKPTKRRRRCQKKRTINGKGNEAISNINTMINISDVPLLDDEKRLLSRGLSFCPRPLRIDKFQLKQDVKYFTRRLRLKELFYDDDDENGTTITLFRRKSKWTLPINKDLALENYITSIEREINRQVNQGPVRRSTDNISSLERKALSSLRRRSDIIIKPADKGSATVVMSKNDNLKRVMQHLNDTQFYERLSKIQQSNSRKKLRDP